MLRHRRQHFATEDLSVVTFGDVRGEALNAPQPTGDAPVLPPPATAAVAEATPAAVAEVGSAQPPAAIVINDSSPGSTPRAGGRDCLAEVVEERRAEKKAGVEVPPSPSLPPPAEETVPPLR